jgi:hypothetical protein
MRHVVLRLWVALYSFRPDTKNPTVLMATLDYGVVPEVRTLGGITADHHDPDIELYDYQDRSCRTAEKVVLNFSVGYAIDLEHSTSQ